MTAFESFADFCTVPVRCVCSDGSSCPRGCRTQSGKTRRQTTGTLTSTMLKVYLYAITYRPSEHLLILFTKEELKIFSPTAPLSDL